MSGGGRLSPRSWHRSSSYRYGFHRPRVTPAHDGAFLIIGTRRRDPNIAQRHLSPAIACVEDRTIHWRRAQPMTSGVSLMEIDSHHVTTCDVSHDGGAIFAQFWPITIGNPSPIRLSLDQAGALL